jgi:DtxR family Mn-dependent transcriptional regulator
MHTFTEENYLKSIFHLSKNETDTVSTNQIAADINTAAATVTDMLKKLADKKLIKYKKYKGVSLTKSGLIVAGKIVRKHRLWETFLVNKLNFGWDEVHDLAEQLEHIKSDELIDRIDKFLGFPKYDPHGDCIPDKNGNMPTITTKPLLSCDTNTTYQLVGVSQQSTAFLQMLDKLKIKIGCKIKVTDKHSFDGSMQVKVDNQNAINISELVAKNLIVK